MELVKDKQKELKLREQAKRFVEQMTTEEKVYQTLHSSAPIERLHIKGYDWWNEGLHGVARAGLATVFPQAIGMASTFDQDLVEQIADAVSTEARAKYNSEQKYHDYTRYKGLTLWAPNINIFRDPRWGRGHETYGEDPYLTSRMGIRYINGLQGHDENYLKTAACVKHFAVHSGPEKLRHEFNAVVTKKDLYETYLPAFKACIQEGNVEAVMGAYNRTNGEPCCGSRTLLIDILRKQWHFTGHVVSDCFAVRDFHEHHMVTSNLEESAAMAMNNGCDLNCGNVFLNLLGALNKGMVSEDRLNEAVTNLYTTRAKLGHLGKNDNADNPFDQIPYSVVDSNEMKQLNLKVAEESLVLLKNKEHILPLDLNQLHTIGIIGPNANSREALVGNYEGTASRYYTVSEGVQDYIEKNENHPVRVLVSTGCHLYKEGFKTNRSAEVQSICEESDVIIACMGLDATIEGEQGDAGNDFASGDKIDLNLPGEQQQILETAHSYGKPVILLLLSGSALSVTWAEEHVEAVMQCWYPGALGGKAIANVLFGKKSPQGHLPVTFYRTTKELPDFVDYSMTGRTYRFMKNKALYPFGYGLTYTHFKYSNLQYELSKQDITISVEIRNDGNYDSCEKLQVYIKASEDQRMNAQLKYFESIPLKKQESKNIIFHLKRDAFELINEDGESYISKDDYVIYVGGSQPDLRSIELMQEAPISFKVNGNQL